jgi:predicted RND superfamily exporter protein
MEQEKPSDDDYEELKKKAMELEAAIEAEKKALTEASENKNQVEKDVQKKEKKEKDLPTEGEIGKDIQKVGKPILQENILKEELRKRKLAIIWIIILIIILSLFFLSEIFWSVFMAKPTIQGNYVIQRFYRKI